MPDTAPTASTPPASGICREVQAVLPGLVDERLPRWRRRLVGWHLRRCEACRREHQRQQRLDLGLRVLEETAADAPPEPPADLLDSLLERTAQPDLRSRAAVPARGAVSGARPGLSAALLVAGALVGTAVGYAGWRGAQAVDRRVRRR